MFWKEQVRRHAEAAACSGALSRRGDRLRGLMAGRLDPAVLSIGAVHRGRGKNAMNGANSAAALVAGRVMTALAVLLFCGVVRGGAGSLRAMEPSVDAAPHSADGTSPPSESGTPAPEEDERGYSNGDGPSGDETPDRAMPEDPGDFNGCPASGRPLELLI
ncbi:MAG: hypothetical protein ABL907_25665 [Hyphomicrobium sp.]